MVPPLQMGLGTGLARGGAVPFVPQNSEVSDYMETTGISVTNAAILDAVLTDAKSVMDVELMWPAGTAYNVPDQTECVIGGSGTIQGSGTDFTAFVEGVQFNEGKWLQFANPAALKGSAISNYVALVVFARNPDLGAGGVFGSYTASTASGIRVRDSGHGGLNGLLCNVGTVSNNPSMSFFRTNPDQNVAGWLTQAFHIRPSLANILTMEECRNNGTSWGSPVGDGDFWNDNEFIHIGNMESSDSFFKYGGKIALVIVGTSSNIMAGQNEASAILQQTAFHRGMVTEDEPIVCWTGDSHLATSYGFAEFVNGTTDGAGLASGGQWTGKHLTWDNAWSGEDTDYFESKYDAFIKYHLERRGISQPLYFFLTVEDTEGLTFAARVAEENPHVTMILSSYIGGEGGDKSALATSTEALASANGWAYVNFQDLSHAQINDGGWGTYGFFIGDGSSHSTEAGRRIKAQLFAAVVEHPSNTSAPRFDIDNPPTITGTEQVGETLTCSTGTPHTAPDSYSYQWLNNLAEISGATSSTYVLQASDEGDYISCRVTAVKSGENSAEWTADPTGAIAGA